METKLAQVTDSADSLVRDIAAMQEEDLYLPSYLEECRHCRFCNAKNSHDTVEAWRPWTASPKVVWVPAEPHLPTCAYSRAKAILNAMPRKATEG